MFFFFTDTSFIHPVKKKYPNTSKFLFKRIMFLFGFGILYFCFGKYVLNNDKIGVIKH